MGYFFFAFRIFGFRLSCFVFSMGAEYFTEGSVVVRRYGACGSAIVVRVEATVRLGGGNSCAISVV